MLRRTSVGHQRARIGNRGTVGMPVRSVLTYPDQRLRQVSTSVDSFDEQLMELVRDLEEIMYDSPGCTGIAAPQIGVPVRVVIVDASRNRKPVVNHGGMVLINPVVVEQEGEVIGREGCLSVPQFTGNVKRAKSIKMRAMARDGTPIELDTVDFEARLILHEIDHLDGILFLDRVSSLKTDIFRRKNLEMESSRTLLNRN